MSMTAFNRYRRIEAMKPENIKAKEDKKEVKINEPVVEPKVEEKEEPIEKVTTEVKSIPRRKKKVE